MHHIEHVYVEEPATAHNNVQLHSMVFSKPINTWFDHGPANLDFRLSCFTKFNLIILQSEYNMAYKSTWKPPNCKITVHNRYNNL